MAVTLLACSRDEATEHGARPAPAREGPTKAEPPEPRPQPRLGVTRDGKPITMLSARAYRTKEDELMFDVAAVPVGCKGHYGGEVESFSVMTRVGDAATRTQVIAWVSGRGQSISDTSGDGVAAAGESSTLAVDFELNGLKVTGTIDAIGCGPMSIGGSS